MKPRALVLGAGGVMAGGLIVWGAGALRAGDAEAGGLGAADRGVTTSAAGPAAGAASTGAAEVDGLGPRGPLDCDRPDVVVAKVDGRAVSAGRVCAAVTRLAGPGAERDPRVLAARGEEVFERVVTAEVVRGALDARRAGIGEDAVDAALAALGKDRAALGGELAAQGLSLDDVRAELRERLERAKVTELVGDLAVDDRAVQEEYARAPMTWGTPPTATVDAWVARVPEGASGAEDEAARGAAARARNDLAGNRSPGGDVANLPTFALEVTGMDPALEQVAFDSRLAIGAWSEPVRTKVGWAVVRVTERRPGTARPLAEVRDRVALAAHARRASSEEARVVAELRDAARVESRLAF